jgi:Zn-dependent protease
MSWKLGRVAGIDVFLHPTFLLLLAYVGMTSGGIGSILLVSAVFGCVLLHELGHALMARRFGIATEDITLSCIGGVARLTRMPRAPGAELLIALAGPAVNVLIVLALAAFHTLVLDISPSQPGLMAEFVDALIMVNMVLALFNLIPAFPMDGGRVLRALLSGWIGRARATMIAAGIGRGLALLFGVYSLFQGSLLQVGLAAFVYIAAGQELARVLFEEGSAVRPGPANRWTRDTAAAEGIWTAPAGFHWVRQGDGVWQLAPITVNGNVNVNGGWNDRVSSPWA